MFADAIKQKESDYKAGKVPQMQSLTLGAGSRYLISERDQKDAKVSEMTSGKRYQWAREQCFKKLDGCTDSDTTDYFDLITKSCEIIESDRTEETRLANEKANKKTEAICDAEIRNCMLKEANCKTDFSRCEEQADFDRVLSACMVSDALGCDNFSKANRASMEKVRDNLVASRKQCIEFIAKGRQTERQKKIDAAQALCGRDQLDICINSYCEGGTDAFGSFFVMMPNKCAKGFEYERDIARELCGWVGRACERMKTGDSTTYDATDRALGMGGIKR
jgi:hypothetical protein